MSAVQANPVVAGVVIFTVVIMAVVSLMVAVIAQKIAEANACNNDVNAGSMSQIGNTANLSLTAKQKHVASQVWAVIRSSQAQGLFPDSMLERVTIITFEAASTESGIRNLQKAVDHDSGGVFQMRPSQGWGTYTQVRNVTYATNKFLSVMLTVPDWQTKPYGEVAQAIERSGYPDRYDSHLGEAEAIYRQLSGNTGGVETVAATTASGCGEDPNQITIDAAIQACLSKLGSSYTWKKPADGASLVSWCYQQAGVSIPGSITKLAAYKGSDVTGVQATWLPPGSNFQAGDVMLWSNRTNSSDRASATSAGMFDGLPLSDFAVATYNLLSATTHTPTSKRVGGCEARPVPGDPTCGKTRAKREAAIISGAAGNSAFDIVGTQETSGIQYAELVKDLPGYRVYPDDSSRMNSSQDGAVAVFYNASKFSRFDQGTAPAISNTSQAVTNPWVGLRTTSGHRIYVMSIHYANGLHGGTPASIMRSSRLTMQWVRSKVGPNTTVIVMGDFNDQPSQKLSYCVYTAGGLMENASDMASGGGKGCAKPPPFNGIDQIYATRGGGLSASGFKHLADSPTLRVASDHTPSFVTFHFPGKAKNSPFGNYIGPRASTGKIGLLPVKPGKLLGALRLNIVAASGDGGVWQSPLHDPCLITAGYGWGDSSVRGYSFHDGVDCGVPTGTAVYAAHSGTVFRAQYDVSGGNQLVVDDSGTVGSGFGFKYEHLSSFVAGVIPGVPIKAGQLVGYSGETGQNVTGPHLHFSICSDVTACLAGSGAQGHATVDPIPFMRAHGVAFVSNG